MEATAAAPPPMNWEPLPPRETSRQARRRLRTESSSTSEQGKSGKKVHPAAKRKPNRPGFNSYLKVILDDVTMDRLHGVAKRIQDKVQGLEKVSSETDDPAKETKKEDEHKTQKEKDVPRQSESKDEEAKKSPQQGESQIDAQRTDPTNKEGEESASTKSNTPQQKGKGKKNRPPRFKPRSRASLHMTFFFGGEALCELPPNELMDWYDKVRLRLTDANFILSPPAEKDPEKEDDSAPVEPEPSDVQEKITNKTNIDETSSNPVGNNVIDEHWFDVTDVRLFPPGRNNLIVAHLEAAPAWQDLHKDIRDIAKNADSQGLNDVTAYSKEKWTAHITMGNIVGGGSKAQVRKFFTDALQQVTNELIEERENEHEESGSSNVAINNKCLFKARTHGIGMGGPIPEQVGGLYWDFKYTPKQKESSDS